MSSAKGLIFEKRDSIELRFAWEATVKKTLSIFCWTATLVLFALPLRAQGGCVDSPENSTIVLGLAAGAAALGVKVWRSHHRKG